MDEGIVDSSSHHFTSLFSAAFLKLGECVRVNEHKMLGAVLGDVDRLLGFLGKPGEFSDFALEVCDGANYGHDDAPFRHIMHGHILHRIPCNCH